MAAPLPFRGSVLSSELEECPRQRCPARWRHSQSSRWGRSGQIRILANTNTAKNVYFTVHTMPTPHRVSISTARTLRKLGSDLRDARLRRRLSMQIVADRARTTRATLTRIERGDPAVAIGLYCSVLNVLGLLEGIGRLADVATDQVGVELEASRLPRRQRKGSG